PAAHRMGLLEEIPPMTIRSWFHNLLGTSRSPRQQRLSRPARLPRSEKLRVEMLEDRLAPAVLTVLNNNDAGPFSLRQAILAANSDIAQASDIIVFDKSLQGQTINLTTGEMAITQELTILGLGADQLTIDAQGGSRIFSVTTGTVARISGLTITGGATTGT